MDPGTSRLPLGLGLPLALGLPLHHLEDLGDQPAADDDVAQAHLQVPVRWQARRASGGGAARGRGPWRVLCVLWALAVRYAELC